MLQLQSCCLGLNIKICPLMNSISNFKKLIYHSLYFVLSPFVKLIDKLSLIDGTWMPMWNGFKVKLFVS